MEKMPFDGRSKEFYERFFQQLGLPIETETQVFTTSRTIDMVVFCTENHRPAIDKTIFDYFSDVNAIELKGTNDSLTLDDYYLIVLRAYGLAYKRERERIDQKLPGHFLPSNITLTIICVTRPTMILDTSQKEIGFQPTDEPGIYHNLQQIRQWIVHPSELKIIPKNYPLLPLARGKTLEDFIEVCVRDGLHDYLEFMIDLGIHSDPKTILKKLLEINMSTAFEYSDETLILMERAFIEFPELISRVSIVSTALDKREQKGREEGYMEGREEGREEGVEVGRVLAKQETVFNLLKHKFDDIPTIMLTMIEDNDNITLLDEWIKFLLTAEDTESVIIAWRETLEEEQTEQDEES